MTNEFILYGILCCIKQIKKKFILYFHKNIKFNLFFYEKC